MRETSRKPDEMYTLLERLSPGSRKIEVRGGFIISCHIYLSCHEYINRAKPPCLQIFARPNNLQAGHGWIGLGNQLNGTRLIEPDLRERYVQVYGAIKEPDPNKSAP